MALNPEHMTQEIRDNILSGDALKARLVLEHLGALDRTWQNRVIYELSRGKAEFTIPLLNHLLSSQPALCEGLPVVRETLISHLVAYPELLLRFLADPALEDRSLLLRIAGELRCEEAVPVLIGQLCETQDSRCLVQVIETLGLIGSTQAVNALTDYLYSADRALIVAAIQALGQVGSPGAMNRLAERMGTDVELDLMILSIFADVQDSISLERLSDALRSHHAHMRIYAKQELERIGSKAVPVLLERLQSQDEDLLVHVLNVLGEIGDDSAVAAIRKLLDTMPKNANVRFAAYEALAGLPLRKGLYTLTAGLSDPEDHVCTAAARAIDKNYNSLLGAGIRNLIRGEEQEARHIVKIIVNAQVDKIFRDLIEEEDFQGLAMEYLPHVHKDVREHYVALLQGAGRGEIAARIGGGREERGRARVCAVDDSRMVLAIYKATLHELGYEPVLFEFPLNALEWLRKEKPLLLFTDLNMPEMSGIQLTERVRQHYRADELPVVMVTTQSDSQDHETARAAGVNDILLKPFSAESLKGAIEKLRKR